MPVCAQCGTENPEIAKFCLACGTQLAAAPPPQEFRKTVTIVFSDLKGSTSLGERLDSESLREVMTRYFDAMRLELERHGGVVEKFIGDAVMAVFGLPKLHEDDALRAVRAAAGMQRALGELNEELDRHWGVRLANRTGVNTGEVVAGDPSAGQRLVTGDAVNVAARLEQAAGEREVLLGELTYQLVRDAVEVESVEPLELKGKAERVPAYRLLSVADKGEGWARRQDAPMVGRQAELELLLSTFEESVSARACRLVTVVGDAGVGKSRLNDEFMHSIAGRAHVLHGRCLSYGEGITFWPLVEALRQAAAIREDDSTDVAREKLASLVHEETDAVVDRVATAIGLTAGQFPMGELFWGARKLLEAIARDDPLVVLFDDIHWAEPTFLDLLEHLLGSVQDAPILLLCPARHDLLEQRPDWAQGPGAVRLVLEPLSGADIEAIVVNLLGSAGIAEAARARITAAAEGNPLFVEQMLSMLIDTGALSFENGCWTATSDLSDLSVPPTIHALLASRLDRLTQHERAIVEPASVIGHVFAELAVRELAPDSLRERVPMHLSDLTRKQFVSPDMSAIDEERFRFNHVLIREATYNGLLKRARATFHERFVEWADRVNRERGREIEYEEILGYHLEQAHRYLGELGPLDEHGRELGLRAADRLASAGRRAFARGDMPAAANLLHRAVDLLPEQSPRRVELLPSLGEALTETGEFSTAQRLLDEAVTLADQVGARRVWADAVITRLHTRHHVIEELEEWSTQVTEELETLIPLLEAEEAHPELAKAWRLLGYVYGSVCRWSDYVRALEKALVYARLAGDDRLAARLTAEYTAGLRDGPTPVREAIVACEQALERGLVDRQAQAFVLCSLAGLRAMEGEFAEGRELIARARRTRDELGPSVIVPVTSIQSSRLETLGDDLEAAERDLRQDYERLSAMGDKFVLPHIGALLARVVCEQGRFDEAAKLHASAQALTDADDVETLALLGWVRARLLVEEGDVAAAEAEARQAATVLPTNEVPDLWGDCLVTLAEVLTAADRPVEARAALDEALDCYVRKGNLVSAERARALALRLDRVAERTA